MAEKIKINRCSYRALLDIPPVGRKIADMLLQQRDLGNITLAQYAIFRFFKWRRTCLTELILNQGDPEDDRSKERDLDEIPDTLLLGAMAKIPAPVAQSVECPLR